MMKKNLEIGTKTYETQQKAKVLEGQQRSYPIWDAFDAIPEWDFIHSMAEMIWDSRHWLALQEPWGEDLQLYLFVLCSRSEALAYILCVRIQGWFPFLAYDAYRNPMSARLMNTVPWCTMDPYSRNVRDTYKERIPGSAVYCAEMQAGLEMFLTHTAPEERVHGENLRRLLCRIATQAADFSEIAAWHIGRSIGQAMRPSAESAEECRNDKEAKKQDRLGRNSTKSKVPLCKHQAFRRAYWPNVLFDGRGKY